MLGTDLVEVEKLHHIASSETHPHRSTPPTRPFLFYPPPQIIPSSCLLCSRRRCRLCRRHRFLSFLLPFNTLTTLSFFSYVPLPKLCLLFCHIHMYHSLLPFPRSHHHNSSPSCSPAPSPSLYVNSSKKNNCKTTICNTRKLP